MGKLKQISELQKLSWHQSALPLSSPLCLAQPLCFNLTFSWPWALTHLCWPPLHLLLLKSTSAYVWQVCPKMPIRVPRRGLKRGRWRECLCVGKSLPLGSWRQHTCSKDPEAEGAHGSSCLDPGMVNKRHFHFELGMRTSDVSHKNRLLARENNPEQFLRSSSDPEREKARA